MQYSVDASGNRLSMLGFGCMRFPRDKAEVERMVLAAIEGGVNVFDTAYIYPGSEAALGNVLAKHNKRGEVKIVTKLPLMMCKSAADFDRLFNEQLKRLKTDYIDYYLLHSVSNFAQWEAMRELGIEDWLAEKKRAGQIRHAGFSFHGTNADFMKLLDAYPWEVCMIQYNYYDENYQAGKKGLLAAAEKGITTLIMEPLLGGRLATGLPKKAVEIFKKAEPDLTPADWALRWLWSQPEVSVVLSGMSSLKVTERNLDSIKNFGPLSGKQMPVYNEVVALFRKSYKINCTGCNYCLPCPKGINIPSCLSAYNTGYARGYITGISMYMTSIAVMAKNPTSPRLCNNCGKCEKLCPQFIPIRKALKKTARRYEPLPVRAILAVVRKVLS